MWEPTGRPEELTYWIDALEAFGYHTEALAMLALTDWEELRPLTWIEEMVQTWAAIYESISLAMQPVIESITGFWQALGTLSPELLETGDQDEDLTE